MRSATISVLALFLTSLVFAQPSRPSDLAVAAFRISCQQPMLRDRRISVSSDEAAEGNLSLYDFSGRLIGTRSFRMAGRGTFVWDLSVYTLPSGAYIFVASHRGRRDVRKLLILR